MGRKINLKNEEKILYEELLEMSNRANDYFMRKSSSSGTFDIVQLYDEMSKVAHKLHMSLKERGFEPKHHKYMLENREVSPDTVEFYKHIHPVDDLLAFIEDTDANNDPEDTTIGSKFSLKIYTRRWGHYDTYKITRTENGWNFEGLTSALSGECERNGREVLNGILDHDSVCYPEKINDFMEFLWNEAEQGLSKSEVQEALDMIGKWISVCEMNTPAGIFKTLI